MKSFGLVSLFGLLRLVRGVAYLVINFYLWEQGKSIGTIVEYNFYIFLTQTLMSPVLSYILVKGYVKALFMICLASLIILGVYTVNTDSVLIAICGICTGLANISFWLSRGELTEKIMGEEDANYFDSVNLSVAVLISLALPFLFNSLVENFSYDEILKISFVGFGGLSIFLMLFKTGERRKSDFIVHKLFKDLLHDHWAREYFKLRFIYGLMGWMFFGLLSILIFDAVGDLQFWAVVTFVNSLVGIIVSQVFKNFDFKFLRRDRAILGVNFMIFAIAPINFLLNPTVENVVIMSVLFNFCAQVNMNAFSGFLNIIQRTDGNYSLYRTSYRGWSELISSLGSLTPMALLFVINRFVFNIDVNTVMFVMFITSIIPMLFIKNFKIGSMLTHFSK